MKFNLSYQPKDAGNFQFGYHVANDGSYLPEADGKTYDYSWKEAVLTG